MSDDDDSKCSIVSNEEETHETLSEHDPCSSSLSHIGSDHEGKAKDDKVTRKN